jgi:hypothetical protein
LLRGDTDFTMTPHLDAWTKAGIRFVFGYDANPTFVSKASILEGDDYQLLERRAEEAFKKRRAKQPRVKEEIIRQRGLLNKKLIEEGLAEFEHRPSKAKKHYRIIVLRKFIAEEQGQRTLGHHFRYFFYVTNDRKLSAEEVVAESNDRCNQEKLIQQLKSSLRALHAPVNTLNANWAYMLMASLAWSLKAWLALMLPIAPRWRHRHEQERDQLLHTEGGQFGAAHFFEGLGERRHHQQPLDEAPAQGLRHHDQPRLQDEQQAQQRDDLTRRMC